MVTISSLKSLVAWIFTWFINDWIAADGMMTVFLTIGAVHMVVFSTTIPMYIYGKRIRKWLFYEARLFEKAGLS
jgi:hypothetical protein